MVELTPEQQQFVDAQVAAGAFAKPADVVGAALDLLQHRQQEYEQLQVAIGQVERGEYEPLDIADVKRRGREHTASDWDKQARSSPEWKLPTPVADRRHRVAHTAYSR